jgi:glutamate synthase domain-containing protein 2
MMNEWGIPSFYMHSLAHQFAEKLSQRGLRVPDLAFAGGFSTEDGLFKALALGSPYVKAVCIGRALMIPGMVGKNISLWLDANDLPKSIVKYGTTVEEIFVCYEEVKDRYGDEIKDIPLGAIGIFTYCEKMQVGLQQLMAGSRNFSLSTISRQDLMALTKDAAQVSGIPYVMDAYREQADKILDL